MPPAQPSTSAAGDGSQPLRAPVSLDILAASTEQRFERVTRMARRLFAVPIACVRLMDGSMAEQQPCIGVSCAETNQLLCLCSLAMQGKGPLVVEDGLEDERFRSQSSLNGDAAIRFYAGQPLQSPSGELLGTLCIMDREPRQFSDDDLAMLADLAGIVERELMAVQLAVSDELTRIANRRGFLALSQYSLDVCKRQAFAAALVLFDLDQFKEINDQYGHAEGDRALAIFAGQLRETFRTSDLFARLGGDEFVALLTNADAGLASLVVRRLSDRLRDCCRGLDLPYAVEFSYGIVNYDPLRHSSVDQMIGEADSLMYASKKARRTAR